MFDKMQRLAERRAHQHIAWGYIIKVKNKKLDEAAALLKNYELGYRYSQVRTRLANILSKPTGFGALGIGMRVFRRFNMISGVFSRNSIFDIADWPYIERVFSDEIMYPHGNPTVPLDGVYEIGIRKKTRIFTSTYWTKKLIGADTANGKGYTGRNILVAIVDTGSRETHPQVRGRLTTKSVLYGQYIDLEGHGIWVSTCIGGKKWLDRYLTDRTGRYVWCEGMAPEVRMIGIKALGYGIGLGPTSAIIAGVNMAIEYRANVINLSLGAPVQDMDKPEDDPEYYVFEEAVKHGIIPIVSAGNSGPRPKTIATPAWLPNVISVGCISPFDGKVCYFSSRGPTVDNRIKPDTCSYGYEIDSGIAGQLDFAGDNVYSKATFISGTSMSAPHVSGLTALMVEAVKRRAPWLRWDFYKMVDMLEKTATEPKNNDYGWGLLTWERFENYMSTEYSVRI